MLLDEHKNGKPQEREVLRLEMTLTQPQPFAGDLALLFDAAVWRAGRFEQALSELRVRTQQRQQAEQVRTRTEKMPAVLAFHAKYRGLEFEDALDLFAQLGPITELERQMLSGEMVLPFSEPRPESVPPSEIEFWGKVKAARSHMIYQPETGIWTLQPGSTFLDRPSL
ncbi:hypothetical protein [Deinococcus alpinitundrae]|uniref:hypothetical protein n=1 Tax=Deinococcus alpinitundrae TaxID=468913 RepID=UPI00137B659D|nr:hypothetical protein [Deinococcus alpinitundrae]